MVAHTYHLKVEVGSPHDFKAIQEVAGWLEQQNEMLPQTNKIDICGFQGMQYKAIKA